ncbi:MAG: TlpA family protein disulfide reductase [Clostridia bacterium]|nr:TlpA family protein disulfide reductase [Clostridia bacterium]
MNNKVKFIIGIIVFAVVIGGAYIAYDKLSGEYKPDVFATSTAPAIEGNQSNITEETTEIVLEPAPDFKVIDKDGNEHKLSDFKGKPVVLNFWASWCSPCKMEMPDFNEAYKNLGAEVQFMMVNLTNGYNGEDFEQASSFMESQSYEFPVFYDTNEDAGSKYYTYSIPVTYFIDADGMLVAQARGAIDADTLQRGIDMIK